jgi:hypothetical protein
MSALDVLMDKDGWELTTIEECIRVTATSGKGATATEAADELAAKDARISELEAALRKIAAGNGRNTKPGQWLADVEMADIARAALSE